MNLPEQRTHTTKAQTQLVWEALQRGEGLTAMDALVRFGCNRLAARIRDIREKVGDVWDVNTETYRIVESHMIEVAGGKRVGQYRLSKSYLSLMRGERRDTAANVPPQPVVPEGAAPCLRRTVEEPLLEVHRDRRPS
jgi:hypothetical protein